MPILFDIFEQINISEMFSYANMPRNLVNFYLFYFNVINLYWRKFFKCFCFFFFTEWNKENVVFEVFNES